MFGLVALARPGSGSWIWSVQFERSVPGGGSCHQGACHRHHARRLGWCDPRVPRSDVGRCRSGGLVCGPSPSGGPRPNDLLPLVFARRRGGGRLGPGCAERRMVGRGQDHGIVGLGGHLVRASSNGTIGPDRAIRRVHDTWQGQRDHRGVGREAERRVEPRLHLGIQHGARRVVECGHSGCEGWQQPIVLGRAALQWGGVLLRRLGVCVVPRVVVGRKLVASMARAGGVRAGGGLVVA